ncbi:monovalent cation/H+ antiporter complex subunit F [Corynebacterium caspium]|uniref:monovalent cation/H+ antiporter complex subunit F n=1 Tax=Corynebacterium caspium TaxID=234828 RepID=UPI0003760C54|nr:monovalent cation/H+ antiporter complex subunit F [Corynebacterium caspium]WKD58676.1 putative monovalent cation/H+ antiporter subunit F [Corynebacterium caspium DSM 44850]
MDPQIYNAILGLAALMFCASFICTAYAIVRGPNSMDRVLSLDGMVAMVQCAIACYICWTMDTTVANAMLVVALLGFISSTAIARFRKRDGA